jgi:acyl-CoA synthetase (AMP-forming)/AMP-acid ligase II
MEIERTNYPPSISDMNFCVIEYHLIVNSLRDATQFARGPMVMRGYWNRPDLTAQALRGGWMHTGDVGYLDHDGYLFVVDRLKDMIITGGENVWSQEVENALASHPAVSICAVIGKPDPVWGETVHAIVNLRNNMSTTEVDLIAHCRNLIAHYKCPRSVDIRDEPLPLSGANKVMKSELRIN